MRESALRFLDALEASGVRYAVLHSEEKLLGDGDLSDLDLTVATSSSLDGLVRPLPGSIIAAPVQASGLRPVLLWWYDLGATASFVVDRDAGTGVQIDVLADPRGLGKYGLRTEVALADRRPGARYHVLDPRDERLYLIQKRALKGMGAELAELLRREDLPVGSLVDRAPAVLFPSVATHVVALLEGRPDEPPVRTPTQRVLELDRRARRFLRPVGAWVHVAGGAGRADGTRAAATATSIAERFERFVPHASAVGPAAPAGGVRQAEWYARRVLPPLTRPAVVVTHGPVPARPAPLVVVDPGHDVPDGTDLIDVVEGRVVEAMASRLASGSR